jgi:hypothetical protein
VKDELIAGLLPLIVGFVALLVFVLLVRGAMDFAGMFDDLFRSLVR